MVIGVLALQGDFKEHMASLSKYGVKALEVRTTADLKQVQAMILPGGESTTIAKLLLSTGLDHAIRERVQQGIPVWGTCAGAILLARTIQSATPLDTSLGLVDIEIERNSYGRQAESFVADLSFQDRDFSAYFIRAPRIIKCGRRVKVLLEYKGDPVLVRQKQVLISTFHTELLFPNPVLEFFLEELV